MRDGLHHLSHDHGELNRRVLAISAQIRQPAGSPGGMAYGLVDLRELLFTHFAREEEGLFPFVAERVPALASRVNEMAIAHDTICGSLSRACYLASQRADQAQLLAVYERFEQAYASHARAESELLGLLEEQLGEHDRERLQSLLDGL
jgi:hypothetical protein